MNITKIKKNLLSILVSIFVITMFVVSTISLEFKYINNIPINNSSNGESSKFEKDYAGNLFLKMNFVDINGLFRRLINQVEMNNIIRLKNGHLTELQPKASDESVIAKANEIERVSNIFNDMGITFVYVQTPYQISKYEDLLPIGYEDYTNENIDRLVDEVHNRDINIIDLRELYHNQNLRSEDIFYKTDHHWNAYGCFWASKYITDYISSIENIEFDNNIHDISNYNIAQYNNIYLGSAGKRTGRWFGGVDNFYVFEPKFETDISTYIQDKHYIFKDAVYNYEDLKKRNFEIDYYENVFNYSQGDYINNNSTNNQKILIVSDSMGKGIAPFMILNFHESMCLGTNVITRELINNYNPDIVIMMIHPSRLKTEEVSYYAWDNLY